MKINNISAGNNTKSKITLKAIVKTAEFYLKLNNKKVNSLNISFVHDQDMKIINEKYLSHQGSTDVITFDYSENSAEDIDGEIIICTDEAKRQAKIYGVLFNKELNRLLFHGLLHLSGYDDTDAKKRKIMKSKEDETLTLWDQYNLGKFNNLGAN